MRAALGLAILAGGQAVVDTMGQHRMYWNATGSDAYAAPTLSTGKFVLDALDVLEDHEMAAVLFGASWCAESRNLYDAAYHAVREVPRLVGQNLPLYYIDIDEEKEFAKEMTIQALPQLVLFASEGGLVKSTDYLGPALAESIQFWVLSQRSECVPGSQIPKIGSVEVRDHFLTAPNSYLAGLAVFNACCDETLEPLKTRTPKDLMVMVDAATNCTKCEIRWNGKPVQQLTEWSDLLTRSGAPIRLDARNIHWLNQIPSGSSVLLLVHNNFKQDVPAAERANRLAVVQQAVKDNVLFYEMGAQTPFEKRVLDYFQLSEYVAHANIYDAETPPFFLFYLRPAMLFVPRLSVNLLPEIPTANLLPFKEPMRRFKAIYKWSGAALTPESISSWMIEVETLRVKPLLESASTPFRFNKGSALMELSANALRDAWYNPQTDVVTLVYTPWSSRSSEALHVFQEVAGRFAATNVSFTTFNAAENHMPLLATAGPYLAVPSISGYPAILVKAAQLGSLVEYPGPREPEQLASYLQTLFFGPRRSEL